MENTAFASYRRFSESPLSSWLLFALLLLAFNLIYGKYFPLPGFHVGHDYSEFLTNLLDGKFWFHNNGFAPPWFTPSFCAGQPFFADPHSAYYAIPQLLTVVASPLTAVRWVLLGCAASLFWGSYLLMQRVFGTGRATAVFVGATLMFNGFLPHRLIVGHLGFHSVAMLPWIALLLMMEVRHTANSIAAAVAAGLLITYWTQSGLSTLIFPASLAILSIVAAWGWCGGSIRRVAWRSVIASVVAVGVSAAKLWAAFSFISHFPRTDYLLPGAASVPEAALVFLSALFLPSQWAHAIGSPHMANVQWELGPHEWAFNFSVAFALLGVALLFGKLRRWRALSVVSPRQWLFALLSFLILGATFAFNVWAPGWNAILKSIPLINTTSSPLRWLIAYLPIIAVGSGLLLERANWGRWKAVAIGACLAATVLQCWIEPRQFYLSQPHAYDVRPMQIANALLEDGRLQPGVVTLGTQAQMKVGDFEKTLTLNDPFIVGVSQVFCYNPVFGYRLEKFSAQGLLAGSVLEAHDGYLNIKNPACYVFPIENGCKPGDRFRADQIAEAKAFVEYRPYRFNVSEGELVSIRVTQSSLLLVLAYLAGWSGWRLLCRHRHPVNV